MFCKFPLVGKHFMLFTDQAVVLSGEFCKADFHPNVSKDQIGPWHLGVSSFSEKTQLSQ